MMQLGKRNRRNKHRSWGRDSERIAFPGVSMQWIPLQPFFPSTKQHPVKKIYCLTVKDSGFYFRRYHATFQMSRKVRSRI